MATIEFLGGAGTVTGSKFLVEAGGRRLLVDCGLYQGLKELRLRNWEPFPIEPRSIDRVVLTHAHIDHTGYLPRLCQAGFGGPVHATQATADLLRVLLPDSGHLQEEEAAFHNRQGTSRHTPALPLYTAEDGRATAARVQGMPYEKPLDLAPGVRVTFRTAGHILGAATVTLELEDGGRRSRVVFSGDIGRYDAPILPDPAPLGETNQVVLESTYGDRRHGGESIPEQLEHLIGQALARDGAVVVPAFAVGRTQELLYHLATLERAGRIPRLPVYVDSPMAVEATETYRAHPEEFDDDMRAMVTARRSPLQGRDLRLARTVEESKAINAVAGPVIIIAASGMATGGRILHHLKRRLPDPRTTVLLVGYQAVGTRGRLLQGGATTLRIFGEDVTVRAHVETVHGLSAHADADGLLRWLRTATRPPSGVALVHGEPGPAEALAARIRAELGWPVTVPAYRDRITVG